MHDLRPHFVLEPGSSVDLESLDPGDTSHVGPRDVAEERLKGDAKRIARLQLALFAEGKRALLVILQGVDTSGKDGTIRGVFARTSPKGAVVTSFAKPSEEELAHDFLWRVHCACPRRGTIGIFNRSHYEDVLVGRVRKLASPETIKHRYAQISAFEELIASSTTILKFMLHISADEQKKRLQSRLDQPHKLWKFDPSDLEDRALRPRYIEAYETVFARCSSAAAPWYVIPSDRKWARDAAVASIVRRTLEDMDPQYPVPEWDPAAIRIT